jgi:hypothetical protein
VSISCDPSDLANAARCFSSCIPDQLAVRSYLLCQYEQKTECCAPVGPDNGSSTGQTQTTIDISWTKSASPNCPITGFLIKWGPSFNDLSTGSATVGPNTFTYTITGLSASTTVFFKIWTLSGACISVFSTGGSATTSAALSPATMDWVNRVQINGGAKPSDPTINCVETWYQALVAAGIDGKIPSCTFFAPDSLIAALTPFFKTVGLDPYVNVGGVAFTGADLSVNGLANSGNPNRVLNTGIKPSVAFADNNHCGLVFYYPIRNQNVNYLGGSTDLSFAQSFLIFDEHSSGTTFFECHGFPSSCTVAGAFTGWVSGQRISSTSMDLYEASSGFAHASVNHNGAPAGTRNAIDIWVFNINEAGGLDPGSAASGTMSFFGVTTGLTTAEDNALWQATDTLRRCFGGGFV